MRFSPITNKAQHFAHLRNGLYGNRLRTWVVKSYLASTFGGQVVVRYLGSMPGKWVRYDLDRADVAPYVEQMLQEGAKLERITINEQAPHDSIVLQGEYSNFSEDLGHFEYSTMRAPMRVAMAGDVAMASAPHSTRLINYHMTPSSAADFWALTDLFPDHVIELTVFSRTVGDLPGRNAIVWEVRRY